MPKTYVLRRGREAHPKAKKLVGGLPATHIRLDEQGRPHYYKGKHGRVERDIGRDKARRAKLKLEKGTKSTVGWRGDEEPQKGL